MIVATDFTSNNHTLRFEDGQQIELTRQQSRELNMWLEKKIREERARRE